MMVYDGIISFYQFFLQVVPCTGEVWKPTADPGVRQAQRPESQEAELEQEYEEQVQERCAGVFGKLESFCFVVGFT